MASPTQRTLAECKKRGWTAHIVEKWVTIPSHPGGGVRIDLFGIGDVLALDGKPGSLMIQACASSGHSARVKKALENDVLLPWLDAGNRFEVWSWGKKGARGKRKLWALRTCGFRCIGGKALNYDDEVIHY